MLSLIRLLTVLNIGHSSILFVLFLASLDDQSRGASLACVSIFFWGGKGEGKGEHGKNVIVKKDKAGGEIWKPFFFLVTQKKSRACTVQTKIVIFCSIFIFLSKTYDVLVCHPERGKTVKKKKCRELLLSLFLLLLLQRCSHILDEVDQMKFVAIFFSFSLLLLSHTIQRIQRISFFFFVPFYHFVQKSYKS